jgi:hypothetical protein
MKKITNKETLENIEQKIQMPNKMQKLKKEEKTHLILEDCQYPYNELTSSDNASGGKWQSSLSYSY